VVLPLFRRRRRAIQDQADSESALGITAQQVRLAQDALRERLREDDARVWRARDLQEAVRNGWSSSVVSIAFWGLVEDGELVIDDDLGVRSLP
jgi:hypothetical protein